jgi:glutamate-1-semialdehyde 2,1-aminomutase
MTQQSSAERNADLGTRLNKLIDWFEQTNPKSADAATKAASVMPGGNTRTVLHSDPFPLVIESGKETCVVSRDGVEYTDFVSEYTCGIFGHSHPKIHDAVQEALKIGINLGNVIGKEAEMGRLIQKRFPSMELMRFTNSGTEANTLALSAALAFSGRKKVHSICLVTGV